MTEADVRKADRGRLTRQAVVEHALALADAEGLDALTFRRLATELGVTPMALYWHVRSKEELLGALADQVWAEIDTAVDMAAPWHLQLRALLESLLRVLRDHSSAAELLIAGEKQSDAALVANETALAILHRGGFDDRHAVEIARTALWTGLMLVTSAAPKDPSLTEAQRAEAQRQSRVRLALLPPDRYPCLVQAAADVVTIDPAFHYEFGVDMFISGVQAMAARS
jgi:TetR/AcrR family transcriptional regulator, tetracycline repressor protein